MQIERLYSEGQYPDVSGLFFGQITLACWNLRFRDMAEGLVRYAGCRAASARDGSRVHVDVEMDGCHGLYDSSSVGNVL